MITVDVFKEIYKRDPDLPGVLARSQIVSPSGNSFWPFDPSRNDIFCCIAEAFKALMTGETRRDATVLSITILYLPLRLAFGPICPSALSSAF